MEQYKANLIADAAYPANANTDIDADAGADANANSTAAAVIAASLIALATSLPTTAVPNISIIMNPYPPRGVLKHGNGSEILCSQSVRFQCNDAFEV
jgi:hypothetical protein